jgi:hypothetical protein
MQELSFLTANFDKEVSGLQNPKWTPKLAKSFEAKNFAPLLWEMQRRAHDIFKQHPQTDFVEIKNNFWAGDRYHDLPTFVFQKNTK